MTKPPVNSQLREVPLSACRLEAGDVTVSETAGGKTPITLHARTGDAVSNWYWGKLVHDMAGFQKPAKVPLDYCHDDEQVLGYGDTFAAGDDGLDIGGYLVSLAAGDRADEVVQKQKLGVPYQASIFFDPKSIEDLMAGATAQVNGQTIEGPASIIRTWGLRGCAVCPYGNDPGTSVELAAKMSQKLHVPQITLPAPGATKMTTTATKPAPPEPAAQLSTHAAPPAAAAPASSPAPATDPRGALMGELRRFQQHFGAEGATYFADGKTFEQAAELHIKAQAEQLTKKDTEVAELKTKLSAAPRGEDAPLSFTAGDKPPAGGTAGGTDKLSHLGAIGKFAQSIKMPGAK